MRIVIGLLAALVAAAPSIARADDSDALQQQGEELAKQGHFIEAIAAFKHADQLQPRASHACLIALAYTRLELWPQADLFLSICHERASATDPLPDWVAEVNQQLEDRLATANVAAVTFVTQPSNARITVSSFAPDEAFGARTIRLPVGSQVVSVSAEGYADARLTLDLQDRSPHQVVVAMAAYPKPAAIGAPETPSWIHTRGSPLLVAGVAAIVAGIGAQLWWGYEHGQLVDATTPPIDSAKLDSYNAHSTRYDIAEYSTIGLYSVGAALVAAGIYLRVTRAVPDEAPAVVAVPLRGGGAVSVQWRR